MLRRINNHDLVPITGGKEDKRPIRGFDLIPYLYCNIYALARKKSGKTTAVTHIVETCALPGFTTVIVFSATAGTDVTWKETFKRLDKAGIAHIHFRRLKEGKEHHLEEFFHTFESQHEEPEEEPQKPKRIAGHLAPPERSRKPRKPKEQAPEYIIVCDDFSTELKDPQVVKLLKEHRHYFAKVIISTQYLTDLRGLGPRGQIDIWLLWGHHTREIIKDIAETVGIRYELLQQLYNWVTKKPFRFLYLDWGNKDLRVNFTHMINKKLLKVE